MIVVNFLDLLTATKLVIFFFYKNVFSYLFNSFRQ